MRKNLSISSHQGWVNVYKDVRTKKEAAQYIEDFKRKNKGVRFIVSHLDEMGEWIGDLKVGSFYSITFTCSIGELIKLIKE